LKESAPLTRGRGRKDRVVTYRCCKTKLTWSASPETRQKVRNGKKGSEQLRKGKKRLKTAVKKKGMGGRPRARPDDRGFGCCECRKKKKGTREQRTGEKKAEIIQRQGRTETGGEP